MTIPNLPWSIERPAINQLIIRDAAGGYVAELTSDGDDVPPDMLKNAELICELANERDVI